MPISQAVLRYCIAGRTIFGRFDLEKDGSMSFTHL